MRKFMWGVHAQACMGDACARHAWRGLHARCMWKGACASACGGMHTKGACGGVYFKCASLFIHGYHWLPLATINLVSDNRKFEV